VPGFGVLGPRVAGFAPSALGTLNGFIGRARYLKANELSLTASTTAADAAGSAQIERFIRANLPLTPVPTVPEICLHSAGPKSGLWRLADADDDFDAPYWAYPWGGGLALARYILDRPEIVDGHRVLDLGSGSGLVGIAAARSGAREVIGADTDRYSVAAIPLNAGANAVTIQTILGDLTRGPPPAVDIVLIGDLFYAEALAAQVSIFADRCVRSSIAVLVGDPGRAFLPRSRLELLAEYAGPDFGDGHRARQTQNAVFSFRS
jgi:predicted nicotinamide N-methyase